MDRRKLQEEIDRKRRELADAESRLEQAERACNHQWGPSIDASIYHPSYTMPGDNPGTMGVDWRGPVHVPGRTEKRWKRVCATCGKEEMTTRQEEKTVTSVLPKW